MGNLNDYNAYNLIKDLYYTTNPELETEEQIMHQYTMPEDENNIGIEMPDVITNVNANHIYKLISAKDIDFNNAFLSNSAISEQAWGNFDPNRRWPTGYPIHINDVYELMNVVDYLLEATNDLWSEINKLKYSGSVINSVWFLNDLQNDRINSIYGINSSQFVKTNPDYCILLDPYEYFTTLPNTMQYFGIGTYFSTNNDEKITRNLLSAYDKRSGINAYIDPTDPDQTPFKVQIENITGVNRSIYGYRIEGIKFYPMFDIDNYFFNKRTEINADSNFDTLVNVNKRQLNYDTYFRTVKTNANDVSVSEFHKVYVDFLYPNYETVGYPYILYYIDKDDPLKKRNIIYIHTTPNDPNYAPRYKTVEEISTDLSNYSEYINFFYNNGSTRLNELGSHSIIYNIYQGIANPYLYHISDTTSVNLIVETPNTEEFNRASNNLLINYYKSPNNINFTIHSKSLNDSSIGAMVDVDQSNSLLYSPTRYFIPDSTKIYIKFNAKYLNIDNLIKYDDEYIDVLLPSLDNDPTKFVTDDEDARKYYYYNGLVNSKRVFAQFRNADDLNEKANSNNNDIESVQNIDNRKCLHLYNKIEDPYKLSYEFTTNSLLRQYIESYDVIKDEVELIASHSYLHIPSEEDENKMSYLVFDHTLSEDYEQIKFNVNLNIDETSKVSGANVSIPFSLSKMHKPCIQFINKDIIKLEIEDYNKLAYTFGDYQGSSSGFNQQYIYTNKNTTPIITVRQGLRKTNQNIINGNTVDDQFYTFSEVYDYLINTKYDNFLIESQHWVNDNTKFDKRTDIGYYINIDHNPYFSRNANLYDSLENTFNSPSTYDNTIYMGNMLEFTYNSKAKYMPIFGDMDMFKEKFVKKENNVTTNLLSYAIIPNITFYGYPEDDHYARYVDSIGNVHYMQFENIFNINGLGFNYRLHGANSYLYINREGGPSNTSGNIPFKNQFDLLGVYCSNSLNNICKFLEIKINDETLDDLGDKIYDNQFDSITKIGSELEENSTLLISNNVLDINLCMYDKEVQNDYAKIRTGQINRVEKITYFIPCTYMTIKNTTVYPNKSTLPQLPNTEYDFSNDEDVNRYIEYINFWNSNDWIHPEREKHKPITLSLQLKENLTNNVPFFYESNVAKVRFVINRIPLVTDETISFDSYGDNGLEQRELIFGEEYYLNDLFIINNETEIGVGSYPEYNEETHHFEIKEWISPSSSEYEPIPKDDNGNPIYEIDKCSRINKINFNKSIRYQNSVGTIDTNSNMDIISRGDYGTYDNKPLDIDRFYKLKINDDFITALKSNTELGGADYLKDTITLLIDIENIYGNKLYKNSTISGANPKFKFKLLYRTIPTNHIGNQIRKITDIQGNETTITGSSASNGFLFESNEFVQYDGFKKVNELTNVEFMLIPPLTDDLYYYDTSNHLIKKFNTGDNRKNYDNIQTLMYLFKNYYIFKIKSTQG